MLAQLFTVGQIVIGRVAVRVDLRVGLCVQVLQQGLE